MAKTQVRAEMVLDDLASATLDKIKGGFQRVDRGIAGAQSSLMEFAKQTAAIAIGANIGNIFGSVKDTMTGAFKAAEDHDRAMRDLAKTVAGMSTVSGAVEDLSKATNMSVKETWALKGAAKGATTDFATGAGLVYDRLSDVARQAGVARGELVAAFAETGKNTTRTNDQLVNLISQVASAARALPAPVKDVVAGFSEIEKNTISASNPLIEMVKQANLFRGHNEQIALKLQAMGRQGMLNVMNKALKEMQERAKKMPMTLAEMGDQLGDMRDDVMKMIGGPMVSALTPHFRRFQAYISENRGKIEEYARTLGTKVGVWVTKAAELIKEGFAYVSAHADEIKRAIVEGFTYAKSVFAWMLEHKTALAAGLIASRAVGSGAVGGAIDAGRGVVEFGRALGALNATGVGPLTAGSASAAKSLGALAAAGVGVALAFDQFQRYLKDTGGFLDPRKGEAKKNLDAQLEEFARFGNQFDKVGEQQAAALTAMSAKMIENAQMAGLNTNRIAAQIEAEKAKHQALVQSAEGMVRARDMMAKYNRSDLTLDTGGIDQMAAAQTEAAKAFSDSFMAAAKSGNQGALNAAVQIVAGSKSLQQSLLMSGQQVGLSLEKLAEVIGDKAGDFGERLMQKATEDTKASAAKPPPTVMQFNGGQTFNIKQDFRDQDPDRVAVIFKRDVARAAENRLQARTVLPFGGLPLWGCLARGDTCGVAFGCTFRDVGDPPMKILVIAAPDMLPPELAANPDVVVVDPASIPEELMVALDEAAGGMLGDADADGGEGPLTNWAGEEEREHGMGGYGDDDEKSGEGDDEETDEPKKLEGGSRGRGGRGAPRFDMRVSGRGAAVPALSKWANAMGRGGR